MKKLVCNKIFIWLMRVCALAIVLIFLFFTFFANKDHSSLIHLQDNWSYSYIEGLSFSQIDSQYLGKIEEWQNLDGNYFVSPPGRQNTNVLIFQNKLPDHLNENFYIRIPEIRHFYTVYLNEKEISTYGEYDNRYGAFGYNLLKLPANASGQTIYIKIYSDLYNIGISNNDIVIGEKYEIVKHLMAQDYSLITMIVILLFIGFVFTLIYLFAFPRTLIFQFGCFSFFSALYIISRCAMRQIWISTNYDLWAITELFCFYLMGVLGNYLIKNILHLPKKHFFSIVTYGMVAFFVCALISPLISWDFPYRILPIYQVLLAFNLFLALFASFQFALKRDRNAIITFLLVLFTCSFFFLELLQYKNIIPYKIPFFHFGIFIMVCLMLYNILEYFLVTYRKSEKFSLELQNKNKVLNQSQKELKSLNQEIDTTQQEVIFRLSEIAEVRSQETGNHVRRVAAYCKIIASGLNLPPNEVKIIELAASMHDIGKLGIPDAILNKPGKLTIDEYDLIKQHTIIGYEMLNNSPRDLFRAASIIAYQHHEHYDGGGYPCGLQGEEIHIYGRITAVADVFDSLASDRIYKAAWPLDSVLVYLKEESGELFDPQVVNVFFDHLDEILVIKNVWNDINKG